MTSIKDIREKFPRVLRISTFDLGGSLLVGYYLGKYIGIDPKVAAVSTIPLGIAVHHAMNIETEITKYYKKLKFWYYLNYN
jgi:hypothetical protein